MQYKTITLGLIRDREEFYEELRSTKRLLPAMDAYAIELNASHEAWKEEIDRRHPGRDPRQVASEALELAIQALQVRLHSVSSRDEGEPTPDVGKYRRQATPPE